MKKGFLSLFLVCCLMLSLIPAANSYAATDLDVSADNVVISASRDYVIIGSTTNTITVNPGITGVNITLNNLSIDVSATDAACAFDIGCKCA